MECSAYLLSITHHGHVGRMVVFRAGEDPFARVITSFAHLRPAELFIYYLLMHGWMFGALLGNIFT